MMARLPTWGILLVLLVPVLMAKAPCLPRRRWRIHRIRNRRVASAFSAFCPTIAPPNCKAGDDHRCRRLVRLTRSRFSAAAFAGLDQLKTAMHRSDKESGATCIDRER